MRACAGARACVCLYALTQLGVHLGDRKCGGVEQDETVFAIVQYCVFDLRAGFSHVVLYRDYADDTLPNYENGNSPEPAR